jgi:ABC-type nitrate/sulfonate/bicarbonate transport system substrate-binding protein
MALLLAAACGDDDDDDTGDDATDAPASQTEAAGSPSGEPEFDDVTVPWAAANLDYGALLEVAARDVLAERGITLDLTFGLDPETVTQLMVQGEAEGGWAAVIAFYPAIEQGAGIRIVSSGVRNTFSYAADPSITSIEDLAGKRIAVHSPVSFTKTVTDALIAKYNIPDTTELIIEGSDVRLQALLDKQIDATTVDLADTVRVQQTEGEDAVNLLSTVSEEFPELLYTMVAMREEFITGSPDVAQAVADAFVEGADRLNSDREYAISLAEEMLPDDDAATREAIIDASIAAGIWNATDLNEDSARSTLDFLYQYGSIDTDPATIELTDFFDFTLNPQ